MITITKIRDRGDHITATIEINLKNQVRMPSVVFSKADTGLTMGEHPRQMLKAFLATQSVDPDKEIEAIGAEVANKLNQKQQ